MFFLKGDKQMQDLKRKYARFVLEGCLKIKKGTPLYISSKPYLKEFTELLVDEAKKMGVTDIYLEIRDPQRARQLLLEKSVEECLEDEAFDRTKMNDYALKNAAFALITSFYPHSMDGVDQQKLGEVNKEMAKRIATYRDMQSQLAWCIFGVPNVYWAKEILKDAANPLEELWKLIFQICHINEEEDPLQVWQEKMKVKGRQVDALNRLHLDTLHYRNHLGTDITIGLPENYLFSSAQENAYLVNLPSEEVFTSPDYRRTEGIVYSSKPLLYNNVFIDEFWIRFEQGRAVSWDAKTGKEMLDSILCMDEGAHFLGECAFVDDDSPISNSKVLFQDTLYDENASCHFALGRGFMECIQGGTSLTKDECYQKGINDSCTHVDFMIGTSDMEIIGTTKDGQEITIMKNGNLCIE